MGEQGKLGGTMHCAKDRLTMRNGDTNTYRASKISETSEENNCLFGQLVDKLGQYEDLGTVEELRELKEKRR